MSVAVVACLLGIIPGVIASKKGHSGALWWVFGSLLFIVALPSSLLMAPAERSHRQCPHCRSWIDRLAAVCARCSRDVTPILQVGGSNVEAQVGKGITVAGLLLVGFLVLSVVAYGVSEILVAV